MKISPQEPHVSPSSKELRRVHCTMKIMQNSWLKLQGCSWNQPTISQNTQNPSPLCFQKNLVGKPILQIFNLSIYQPIPTTPDLVAELEVAIALLLQANYPARRRDKPGKCPDFSHWWVDSNMACRNKAGGLRWGCSKMFRSLKVKLSSSNFWRCILQHFICQGGKLLYKLLRAPYKPVLITNVVKESPSYVRSIFPRQEYVFDMI